MTRLLDLLDAAIERVFFADVIYSRSAPVPLAPTVPAPQSVPPPTAAPSTPDMRRPVPLSRDRPEDAHRFYEGTHGMTSNSNPIDAVRTVLDEGRAWIKGKLSDNDGHYCMVGAAIYSGNHLALHGGEVQDVILEQYRERVDARSERAGAVISTFNNHPDTTWHDVDLVLDKAARRLDEQGAQ